VVLDNDYPRSRVTPLLSLSLLFVCLAGCVHRERANLTCDWPQEPIFRSLDLRNASDRRHLRNDVAIAEDLAIRYADLRRGHRSGRFEGVVEYARTRDECMATLFGAVGNAHGLGMMEVRDGLGSRSKGVDAAVILSFAALYALAVNLATRWMVRGALVEHAWLAAAVALVASAMVSAAGVLLGGLWSAALEMMRVGNDHLSYRAYRVPWGQHHLELFVAGIVVFWLIGLAQYQSRARAGCAG